MGVITQCAYVAAGFKLKPAEWAIETFSGGNE